MVGSLWAVDDVATAVLLTRFYDLWLAGGLPGPAALAEAQRWLRSATNGEIAARYPEIDLEPPADAGPCGTGGSNGISPRRCGGHHSSSWGPDLLATLENAIIAALIALARRRLHLGFRAGRQRLGYWARGPYPAVRRRVGCIRGDHRAADLLDSTRARWRRAGWRTGSSGGRPGRCRSGTSSCRSPWAGSQGARSSAAAGGRGCSSARRPLRAPGTTCSWRAAAPMCESGSRTPRPGQTAGCWAYSARIAILGAYASGPPYEPDLYLSDTAEAVPGTGEFKRGGNGLPYLRGSGLLIRYEEILYIEVTWHEKPAAAVDQRREHRPGPAGRASHSSATAHPAARLPSARGGYQPATRLSRGPPSRGIRVTRRISEIRAAIHPPRPAPGHRKVTRHERAPGNTVPPPTPPPWRRRGCARWRHRSSPIRRS